MEKNDAIELALCVRDSGAMPSIVMALKYPNSISISGAGVSIVGGSDGADSHSRIDHTFRGPSEGMRGPSLVFYGPRSSPFFLISGHFDACSSFG
ncbi:hypothetical protein E2C01_074416 [Portunus trituberculatus]|uniref:Uncharacterized protein n=1 Tax=Portunus trituberculatus TaxID=210409 RepID=A0A5B7IC31_PORTR|nr:hypothetical protein [Portunus trituberculatus]